MVIRVIFSLDPVQITQMAKYLETVYVSGWQCSSTASSTNEPGPDLAGGTGSTLQYNSSRAYTDLILFVLSYRLVCCVFTEASFREVEKNLT